MKANYCDKTGKIVLKKDWLRELENLDDIDAGQLVKAIYAYANGYSVDIEDNPQLLKVFIKIAGALEDNAKWYLENKPQKKERDLKPQL